jgi:hypothetical protein
LFISMKQGGITVVGLLSEVEYLFYTGL